MDAAGLTEIEVFESVFPCSLVRFWRAPPAAVPLEGCRVLLSSLKARLVLPKDADHSRVGC